MASIQLAAEVYEFVLERLGDHSSEIKAVLFLPLRETKVLAPIPPPRGHLVDALGEEPPSVYLISREVDMFLYVREEYRVPYELELAMASRPDVFCWYRAHRDTEAYENDWEYSRSIMIEHYPERFRFKGRP